MDSNVQGPVQQVGAAHQLCPLAAHQRQAAVSAWRGGQDQDGEEGIRSGGQQQGAARVRQKCGGRSGLAAGPAGLQPLRHANPATLKRSMATCRRKRQNVRPAHRSTSGTLRNTCSSISGGRDRMFGFSRAAWRCEWRVGARGASIAQHPGLVRRSVFRCGALIGPSVNLKHSEPCGGEPELPPPKCAAAPAWGQQRRRRQQAAACARQHRTGCVKGLRAVEHYCVGVLRDASYIEAEGTINPVLPSPSGQSFAPSSRCRCCFYRRN